MLHNDVLSYISQYVNINDQRRFRTVNRAFSQFKLEDRICCHEPLPSELYRLINLNVESKIKSTTHGGIRFILFYDDIIYSDPEDKKIMLYGANVEKLTPEQAFKLFSNRELDYSSVENWKIVHWIFSQRKSCPNPHACFLKFIRQHLLQPNSRDITEVLELLEDIGRILNDEKFHQITDDLSNDIGQGSNEEMNASIPEFMQWLDQWISKIKSEDLGVFFFA